MSIALQSSGTDFDKQKRTSVVHHVVAASIATTIVVVGVGTAGMVVAATKTAIVGLLAMMIVSVGPTDVVTTMVPVELIATLRVAAMIATAAAGTTIVVEADLMAEMKGALQLTPMLLQGRPASLTAEVETKNTVLTIGTPVNDLRSANPFRCGALCQITRPNLSISHALRLGVSRGGEEGFFGYAMVLWVYNGSCRYWYGSFAITAALISSVSVSRSLFTPEKRHHQFFLRFG